MTLKRYRARRVGQTAMIFLEDAKQAAILGDEVVLHRTCADGVKTLKFNLLEPASLYEDKSIAFAPKNMVQVYDIYFQDGAGVEALCAMSKFLSKKGVRVIN